jgi:lysozyme
MLDRDEGKRYVAYPDPITHGEPYTIGKGHTGPEVHPGLVWDDNQIEFAFQLDMAEAIDDCNQFFQPWYGEMNPARQTVLESMCFQMGAHRVLEFHDTLRAMREGRYVDAAEGMRNSIWGHQTPLRVGLLAKQMETGIEQ